MQYYTYNGYKINVLKIIVFMVSLRPFVAEHAARHWDEYHTYKRECINPVAVCLEELA